MPIDTGTFRVLKETADWIAVEKPKGMVVEERHDGEELDLVDLVRAHLQGNKPKRDVFVGVVHRLDRATSGVVLMAKKKSALKLLNKQFEERKIRKTYLAKTKKAPEQKSAIWKDYISRDGTNKKAIITKGPVKGAKIAEVHYRILEKTDAYTFWELHPKTGRFHQLRVQLAHRGFPIIGDTLYHGGNTPPAAIELQALRLGFFDPGTGDWVVVGL